MSSSIAEILKSFPETRFHRDAGLLTWHPRGILDDRLADDIASAVSWGEGAADQPFDRYTDFSLLTDIRLRLGHLFQIAEYRRRAAEPVRSAFFAESAIGFGIARLYEELMQGAPIEVRAFRDRAAAAEWLDVPAALLKPCGPSVLEPA